MTTHAEPERQMVARATPYALAAVVVALVVGGVAAGWGVGASAAIGVAVVFANFAVNGFALARAARASMTAYSAVAMGGFAVRLGAILAMMFLLDRLAFFSPLAFGLAVIPGTLLLLLLEVRLMMRGLGQELVIAPRKKAAAR